MAELNMAVQYGWPEALKASNRFWAASNHRFSRIRLLVRLLTYLIIAYTTSFQTSQTTIERQLIGIGFDILHRRDWEEDIFPSGGNDAARARGLCDE